MRGWWVGVLPILHFLDCAFLPGRRACGIAGMGTSAYRRISKLGERGTAYRRILVLGGGAACRRISVLGGRGTAHRRIGTRLLGLCWRTLTPKP